jgi:hypothetical protein
MSHDLCLYSRYQEFPLAGSPDSEDLGLGRSKVLNGNAGYVVDWYTRYCQALAWPMDTWIMKLTPPAYERDVACDLDVLIAATDSLWTPPDWAQNPVSRHIAMIDAFLAFAPGARFGSS